MDKAFHRKWVYHADHEPVLVETSEQEKSLGAGWVDSPAHVKKHAEPKPHKEPKPKLAKEIKA